MISELEECFAPFAHDVWLDYFHYGGFIMETSLTFYGHSAFLLKTGSYHILIDPFLKYNHDAPVSPDEVLADYILVTHGHGDHLGDTISIAKRTGAMVISNSEICDWLETLEVKVHAQSHGGGYHHPFGYLKLTYALHGGGLDFVNQGCGGNPAGLLLTTLAGKKIYHAGDTGLFGDMQLIGDEGLDVACLPIGDNYTMGPDDALRAVKFLHPKVAIPMHYDTEGLLKQDAVAWKERVERETGTKVVILKPGETFPVA
jgi:L-ascorbate metabolism protein UlaG (beta-lactamase superfamily)